MPDNKNERRPLDAKRINVHESYEISNWCKSLNCTPDQLRSAVAKVGTSAEAVKDFLSKNRRG
jgi:hypothetical protein